MELEGVREMVLNFKKRLLRCFVYNEHNHLAMNAYAVPILLNTGLSIQNASIGNVGLVTVFWVRFFYLKNVTFQVQDRFLMINCLIKF